MEANLLSLCKTATHCVCRIEIQQGVLISANIIFGAESEIIVVASMALVRRRPHIIDNISRTHRMAYRRTLASLANTENYSDFIRRRRAMDGIRNLGEVDTHFFFFYRNISNVSSAHRAHTTFTVFAKHLFLMDSLLELMVSVEGIENGFGFGSRHRCDAYHNFKPTLGRTYVNNVVPNRIIVHHR